MGIETSCDDTCISCIDGHGKIILNYQIPQNHIHKEYGGVHPSFAKLAHVENLNHYMELAITQIYNSYNRYPHAIAYTIGPGLEICLSTGVMKVYEISNRYNIPIIPTHHIESHIMVCRLPELKLDVSYPFISCVISGGHTFICYVESEGVYQLLSTTVDDSMGEVIDKVARELGISDIPAGKDFEKLATGGNNAEYAFPHPHIKEKPYDLSFSGLKFAGIDMIKKIKISNDVKNNFTANFTANFAASFQDHIFKYMISQLKKVYIRLIELNKVNCIVLAGGVASNMVLRSKMDDFGKNYNIRICYPPPNLCTDNGIMVAWNGVEKLISGFILPPVSYFDPKIKYDVRPRWKLW
jgi:N6-L-threonylcarbamoyladenine synthase